jgi:adenylate cyclase
LFGGIGQAASAAVISVPTDAASASAAEPRREITVRHWDRRLDQAGDFQPSQRLIFAAVEKQQTVLHVWEGIAAQAHLTVADAAHDWAFVTPLPAIGNHTHVLYVSGVLPPQHHSDSADTVAGSLQEDIKYAELVANILGSLLSLRHLQQRQASLRAFFSPVVLDALQDTDPEELFRPRQCEVSILFCDLRGFSAASERLSHDLMQLLQRVSEALGVTTRNILRHRGVVGDFHGDATMGFWGWPLPQADRVQRACQAAIEIHQQFQGLAADPDSPLHGFQLGLGIASGTAVAGQIGTQDQVKVTAFGPVVNLAARLETMNRQLGTSILIEKSTADVLQLESPEHPAIGWPFRIRPLGKVLPAGLTQPIEVCEVLPPCPPSPLSDQDLEVFAQGLAHFQSGQWEVAYNLLHRVPAADRAKDLLTMLITQHNRQAPYNWDGIVRLQQK